MAAKAKEAPEDLDPKEQVLIEHDDIEGSTEVSRSAFDKVWQHKGWKLASPDTIEEAAADNVADQTEV